MRAAVNRRVAVLHEIAFRVEHLPGPLRGGSGVKVDEFVAVHPFGEKREILADPADLGDAQCGRGSGRTVVRPHFPVCRQRTG
jgi:hypothetical protein